MMKRVAILGSAVVALAALGATAQAQFKSSLNESQATANEAKASQQRIDQLDTQTTTLVNDYRANLKQLESVRRFNASLERNIESQVRKMAQLEQDIGNISGLQRAMQPLMEDMVEALGDIVKADLPFRAGERADRVARLEAMMGNSDISAAQRYRLIVEAYQIENEYGRTIGFYEGNVDHKDESISGEFLRVGRVTLMFKTSDDSVLKVYDMASRSWENLSKSYLPDVKLGLRMAKEQTAPGLLPIPVKAPVAAQ